MYKVIDFEKPVSAKAGETIEITISPDWKTANAEIIEENNVTHDFDFWSDRVGLRYASYNGAVSQQIYDVANLIVEARKNGTRCCYCTDIANTLDLTPEHVELIQYILAGVKMPVLDGKPHYTQCFTYGTSPRGLFVDDMDMCEAFMAEFRAELAKEVGNG